MASKLHSKRGLTIGQKKLAEEYVRNGGNITQAGLVAYPNQTPASSRTHAQETLQKPAVLSYIRELLEGDESLSLKGVLGELSQIMRAEVEEPISAAAKLSAIEKLLRLHDAYPTQNAKVNYNVNIEKLSEEWISAAEDHDKALEDAAVDAEEVEELSDEESEC